MSTCLCSHLPAENGQRRGGPIPAATRLPGGTRTAPEGAPCAAAPGRGRQWRQEAPGGSRESGSQDWTGHALQGLSGNLIPGGRFLSGVCPTCSGERTGWRVAPEGRVILPPWPWKTQEETGWSHQLQPASNSLEFGHLPPHLGCRGKVLAGSAKEETNCRGRRPALQMAFAAKQGERQQSQGHSDTPEPFGE